MPDLIAGDSSGSPSGTVGGSPTTTAPPESSSAATTVQPGTEADSSPKGPIPYERFEEVNRKYGALSWAEGLDGDHVRQQTQFFQWLDSDPEGAFRYMQDYLTRAGALKPRRAAPTPDEERPQPDVVVPETGQKFYSADAAEKLTRWIAKQTASPLEQRLQSIEAQHVQGQAATRARTQLADAVATLPHFVEHQKDILAAMEKDSRLGLEGAYNRVVVPKLRQLERDAILKEIQQKAHAGTVDPSRTGGTGQATPGKRLGFAEAFRREFTRRSA